MAYTHDAHQGFFRAFRPIQGMRWGTNARTGLFVVASILSHTALSVALPGRVPPPPRGEPEAVAFAVVVDDSGPPEPEPEPDDEPVLPEPEPEPMRPPRPRPVEAPEPPEPQSAEAPPVEEPPVERPPSEEPLGDPNALPGADDPQGERRSTLASAVPGGLNVGLPAGSGSEGAQRGTLRRGRAASSAPRAPTVDRRALVQRYLREVQRALGAPTQTRALRRAGLEGVVMVALRIDPQGIVRAVRVRTSSGMALLDEAALAHVRRFARVPPPPAELAWVTREITLPVRYRTRRRR